MYNVSIKPLAVVCCLALLTASCGGDSSGSSPADQYNDDSGTGGGNGDGSGGSNVVKMGNGTGANFEPSVIGASDTNLQAGASTDISVNLVGGDNTALNEEFQINFSSDCVSNALASFSQGSVATSAGRASTTYTSQGCSGTDTVTATTEVDGTIHQASIDLSIAADAVLSLQFESSDPPQLALKGMGNGESSRVTFKLVGEQGAPIRNQLVTFNLSTTAGGISLAPDEDGDPTEETVTSDNSGLASVVVRSGTVATTVRVIAEHNSTGIQGTSQDLDISTGVPANRYFSVSHGPHTPPGAHNTDGVEVTFGVIASDQFGNDALDGTRVSFWTPESGNIDSSCVLESGQCSATWISSSPRPDDGRATVIAYTNGAEDFEDLNGNNVFDEGESWTDLSEAYADTNENGNHDSGEYFVDTNRPGGTDGAWDAASQLPEAWDGPCLNDHCPGESSVTIWDNSTIIISLPQAKLFTASSDSCPQQDPFTPAPNSTIDLSGGPVSLNDIYIADARDRSLLPCHIVGNSMPAGTTIEFETDNGEISGTSSWTVPDNASTAYYISSVRINPDDDPSSGTLTLTVTPSTDDPPTTFNWDVKD